MADFLGRPVNPNRLSSYTVQNDRWDKKMLDYLLTEMKDFRTEQAILCDTAETGDCLWGDLLWDLYKVEPHPKTADEIRPSYLVNQRIMTEFDGLTQREEVRAMGTIGDDVAAAMGVMALRPDVQGLMDKLKKESEQAKQIEQQMMELLEYGQDPDADAETAQAMQDAIDEALQDLQDALDGKSDMMRAQLKRAGEKAAKDADDTNQAMETYGFDRGSLQRMDGAKRIALAKKLNTQKLRDIADLFGRMRRLQLAEQKRKTDYARDEVVSLTVSDDLARMLPQELARMEDEDLSWLFWLDFVEGRVPSYKLEGTEKIGRGGIRLLMDGSGSMAGVRDVFTKAFALCLVNQSRDEHRSFAAFQFGSASELIQFSFKRPEDYTPDRIIDLAEFFFGGGTECRPALRAAMDDLMEEAALNKLERSDIVIVTDGDFPMDEEFLAKLKKDQATVGARIYGLSILHPTTENLRRVCDGRVFHIKDLASGQDLRGLFGQM